MNNELLAKNLHRLADLVKREPDAVSGEHVDQLAGILTKTAQELKDCPENYCHDFRRVSKTLRLVNTALEALAEAYEDKMCGGCRLCELERRVG